VQHPPPATNNDEDTLMAQIATTGAERAPATAQDATDNVAELRKRTVDQVADRTEDMARTVQRAAGAVAEGEREVAHQAAAGATKLGRGFVDLAHEQTRHNLETLQALAGAVDWTRFAKAVDWDRVFQIQRAYLRASLERAARLTRGCLGAGQAVVTTPAASAAQRQAPKAT
jgi:hypothetical protein